MLEETDINFITFALVGFVLILKFIEWRMGRRRTPIKKAFLSFRVLIIMMGASMLAIIVCLPSSHHFTSYDYPDGFKSFAEIDRYMQETNRVLGRMRDVIFYLILILGMGVLQSLYQFAIALEKSKAFDEGAKQKVLNLE
jgi:hypothetical protein